MQTFDFDHLIKLNEAIDVWADMHDHDVRPPPSPTNPNGVATVRIRGL